MDYAHRLRSAATQAAGRLKTLAADSKSTPPGTPRGARAQSLDAPAPLRPFDPEPAGLQSGIRSRSAIDARQDAAGATPDSFGDAASGALKQALGSLTLAPDEAGVDRALSAFGEAMRAIAHLAASPGDYLADTLELLGSPQTREALGLRPQGASHLGRLLGQALLASAAPLDGALMLANEQARKPSPAGTGSSGPDLMAQAVQVATETVVQGMADTMRDAPFEARRSFLGDRMATPLSLAREARDPRHGERLRQAALSLFTGPVERLWGGARVEYTRSPIEVIRDGKGRGGPAREDRKVSVPSAPDPLRTDKQLQRLRAELELANEEEQRIGRLRDEAVDHASLRCDDELALDDLQATLRRTHEALDEELRQVREAQASAREAASLRDPLLRASLQNQADAEAGRQFEQVRQRAGKAQAALEARIDVAGERARSSREALDHAAAQFNAIYEVAFAAVEAAQAKLKARMVELATPRVVPLNPRTLQADGDRLEPPSRERLASWAQQAVLADLARAQPAGDFPALGDLAMELLPSIEFGSIREDAVSAIFEGIRDLPWELGLADAQTHRLVSTKLREHVHMALSMARLQPVPHVPDLPAVPGLAASGARAAPLARPHAAATRTGQGDDRLAQAAGDAADRPRLADTPHFRAMDAVVRARSRMGSRGVSEPERIAALREGYKAYAESIGPTLARALLAVGRADGSPARTEVELAAALADAHRPWIEGELLAVEGLVLSNPGLRRLMAPTRDRLTALVEATERLRPFGKDGDEWAMSPGNFIALPSLLA